MTLQWSEELVVGHAEIDKQHQQLIDKFNTFLLACHVHKGREQLLELFNFLDRYVVFHFREEEQLMELYNYPDLRSHRKEHQDFKRRLTLLRAELDKADTLISVLIHTNKALIYWLTTHIKQIDAALGKYLATADGPC
jgi:hemerythrin